MSSLIFFFFFFFLKTIWYRDLHLGFVWDVMVGLFGIVVYDLYGCNG